MQGDDEEPGPSWRRNRQNANNIQGVVRQPNRGNGHPRRVNPNVNNRQRGPGINHHGLGQWRQDNNQARMGIVPGQQRGLTQSVPRLLLPSLLRNARAVSHSRDNLPGPQANQHNRGHIDNHPLLRNARAVSHSRDNLQGPQANQHNRGHQQNKTDFQRQGERHNDETRKHGCMGFRRLEELANSNISDIIMNISRKKDSFFELLNSTIHSPDMNVLLVETISKICQSPFHELKLKLLLEICKSSCIQNLRTYLMDLPYTQNKKGNNLYWANEIDFWKNFVMFLETLVNLLPSIAFRQCRSLIEAESKYCLQGLNEKYKFTLPEEYNIKLIELREKMAVFDSKKQSELEGEKPIRKVQIDDEDSEPPEDFRQLSVLPTGDDLFNKHPFIRANIINGKYKDVEHYLDVQFRLMREDYLGPLRQGIFQYLTESGKKRYDNIRVHKNVTFAGPYVTNSTAGVLVQVDDKTCKTFRKVRWEHSKRFIFGSLLIFFMNGTHKKFILATVLDRNVKLLSNGLIPVAIVNDTLERGENMYANNHVYDMIESEIYFEPYYHVLKVLQDRNFPNHIAMKKYIVDVDPTPAPPAYLTENTIYTVETNDIITEREFKVLQPHTWPSAEELQLNKSQYEAYKLSLKHEFAVIQGPPGTGKTFLGLKIAETLLKNNTERKGCFMLIVCYTNHALDQFLEAILTMTRSVVRIGGQSRNKAMDEINLNTVRKRINPSRNNAMYRESRTDLEQHIRTLKSVQDVLYSLRYGVVSYSDVEWINEAKIIKGYPGETKDSLINWLFEYRELEDISEQVFEENENNNFKVDNDIDRNNVVLDDLDDEESDVPNKKHINIKIVFSLEEAGATFNRLRKQYMKKDNNQQIIYQQMQHLQSYVNLFNKMAEHRRSKSEVRLDATTDPSRIPVVDRWKRYFKWVNLITMTVAKKIKPLETQLETANSTYEEARMMVDATILKECDVIGMTTSGAARLRKLIQAVGPKIIIVEEAAEVLEQHIVTSLTKSCQHLILIGDHQQLRPSAAHMKLAKDYNIEVSLFERMIMNNIHSRRLNVQHRMRPEIAELISPHIYPDLANHPSVVNFPPVRGVLSSLFFMTHDHKEEEANDSSSKTNQKEGDLVLAMANYLRQQDYSPSDVTILTPYSGQMFYMRQKRNLYSHLADVKITVVDNYQGEESKIILLSLVRNNNAERIGFLGIENRVCVALSRAREGFFMFGNIEILKRNSGLWRKIAGTLEKNDAVGTSMTLACVNHPESVTNITCPDDFLNVPEGGCLLKCKSNLMCGHPCSKTCHGYDRDHIEVKCYEKCERILCQLDHVCPQMCWEECQPCNVMVIKMLPCGHTMRLRCHEEPNDPTVKCTTVLDVKLPHCGHEAKKLCSQDIRKVKCLVPCPYRVEKCGHECKLKCHVTEDPHHEDYTCKSPCARAKKGCTAELIGDRGDHQCTKLCYEACEECHIEVVKKRTGCKHTERVRCCIDVDDSPCLKKCARSLPCGHHCKKKCFEPCGDCNQIVNKTIPECNHTLKVTCKTEVTRLNCVSKCERKLSCGHTCKQDCREPCDPKKCTEPSMHKKIASCGHLVSLPCNMANLYLAADLEKLSMLCTEMCGVSLACGHICSGTCASCQQGRMHVPCTQTCHQLNICGHQCEEPCNQLCPPCNKPCEVKCPHSRCNQPCGAPCTPCQEKCERSCSHGSCTRRCGEPCNRAPCERPCDKTLPCGHPCRGLCGEPCPNICNFCRPDDFPKDFLGDDYEHTDKFVQMEDCSHVLEVENMDNLMMGDSETITIRSCPFCRKPIINTYRYKDLVNHMFKTSINPIKEKVYGNAKDALHKKKELSETVKRFHSKFLQDLKDVAHCQKAFNLIAMMIKNTKKSSLIKIEMQLVYVNILEMICERHQKCKTEGLVELYDVLTSVMKMICKVLIKNVHKISQQQQMDIRDEIKRMDAIIIFSKIMNHALYRASKASPNVIQATESARKAIVSQRKYKDEEGRGALKKLETSIKVAGIVTKEERDLVIKAIGLKAGHWYKCPNGHYYCIGECGGAMEVSRCIECGVDVGGERHALLSTNRHAGELDGSRFAAWSEEYNNMGNFLL